MEPFQQRVIQEADEVKDRLNKLGAFLNTAAYAELDSEDQSLLWHQHKAMAEYHNILEQRIARFTLEFDPKNRLIGD